MRKWQICGYTDRMSDFYNDRIVSIFGVSITLFSKERAVQKIYEWLLLDEQKMIVTANPETLLYARNDENFKRAINSADLITADGAGVCWAATFFEMTENSLNKIEIINIFLKTLYEVIFSSWKKKVGYFPARISGSDLIWDLAEIAEKENKKIYLIGGKNQTAFRAAQKIKELYPTLEITAFQPDHVATPYLSYELHNELERYKPDILLIAYGSPKQEEWIIQNLRRYRFIKMAMGVGGTLDFIAGNTVRASLRLQSHGLEWFWRFYHRPTRVLRVFRSTVIFPTIILLSRLKKYGK